VAEALLAQQRLLAAGGRHDELVAGLPAGAARNALDCALWDWTAKAEGIPVWRLAEVPRPQPVTTCFTISLDEPAAMEAAARQAAARPILKIKLGGEGDEQRIAAIRRGAPDARLVVDANEAWTPLTLPRFAEACAKVGVELIEQPLPAADDSALEAFRSPVPLCADESAHGIETLDSVAARYQAINIKLDKTGGLTDALTLAKAAKAKGLRIMVGCMLGTSLAMAPAVLLAGFADYIDLDGPLLLARDRSPGLTFEGSQLLPPPGLVWG